MRDTKLGPVLLTGFIIGPILGSGIIILPPLVHDLLGTWALPAWVVISLLGALFAAVFGSLSVLFPGDSGVSECVGQAFGPRIRTLTSFFLIGAVCFGPVAVALTAARYLGLGALVPDACMAALLVLLIWMLLLRQVTSLGQVAFILSTGAAVLLATGAAGCLLAGHRVPLPATGIAPERFGYGLLVLFWTVVGWEIIGNYSAEIRDPRRTIPRAVVLSVIVIAGVTLLVAAAVQSVGGPTLVGILEPAFGRSSVILLGGLAVALCLVTELAFTGAVSRLLAAQAANEVLPGWIGHRNRAGAPVAAVSLLTGIHLGVLGLVGAGWFDVEKLVAMADGFFLANAITALLAGARLLESPPLRGLAAILACILCGVLAMSAWPVLLVLIVMTGWALRPWQAGLAMCGGANE